MAKQNYNLKKSEDKERWFSMESEKAINKLLKGAESEVFKYYKNVPEVSQVINGIANRVMNFEFKFIDSKGNEVSNTPIIKAFNKPNVYQSTSQLIKENTLFKLVTGESFLLVNSGETRGLKKPTSFFNLDPTKLKVDKSATELDIFANELRVGMVYKWGDNVSRVGDSDDTIDYNKIIHLVDNSIVNFNPDTFFRGSSRMLGAEQNIKNCVIAANSRGRLAENLGAVGMITGTGTDGTNSIQSKEIEETQNWFSSFMGKMKGGYKIFVSPTEKKFVNMGSNVSKLELINECKESGKVIANQYNYPSELLGQVNSYENYKIADKSAYLNCALPIALDFCAGFNKMFNETYKLIPQFDHIEVLQENKKANIETNLKLVELYEKGKESGGLSESDYKKLISEIFNV